MVSKRQPKTYSYRYVDDLHRGRTLEELLRGVLRGNCKQWSDRVWVHKEGNLEVAHQLINYYEAEREMLCGMYAVFAPDSYAEVLTLDQNSPTLPPDQVPPPAPNDNTKAEYVEGRLYFGVLGNHVIVVQDTAHRTQEFERYLRWLLAENAEILRQGESINLKEQITGNAERYMRRGAKLSVGVPLNNLAPEAVEAASEAHAESLGGTTVNLGGAGWDALRMFVGERYLEGLEAEQLAAAGQHLEVDITVKRVGHAARGRNAVDDVMEHIGAALRHEHDDAVRLELPGGSVLKGDEIRLKCRKQTEHRNGRPLLHSVFENMERWLRECLECGYIESGGPVSPD